MEITCDCTLQGSGNKWMSDHGGACVPDRHLTILALTGAAEQFAGLWRDAKLSFFYVNPAFLTAQYISL